MTGDSSSVLSLLIYINLLSCLSALKACRISSQQLPCWNVSMDVPTTITDDTKRKCDDTQASSEASFLK